VRGRQGVGVDADHAVTLLMANRTAEIILQDERAYPELTGAANAIFEDVPLARIADIR
jgi:hypothetical protein